MSSLIYQLASAILRDNFDQAKNILKKSDQKDVLQARHEINNPPVIPIDREVQARLDAYMAPIVAQWKKNRNIGQGRRTR